jgi:cytochrome P450
LLFKGYTTISSAISWACFIIGNNRHVQTKIQEELKEIFTEDDELITITKLDKMQYIERVIKEVFRLYPSIPSIDRLLDNNAVIGKKFLN